LALTGCGSGSSYSKNASLSLDEKISLTICGAAQTNASLEKVITSFNKIYPNCSVHYECVMDYNNALTKRLANNDSVDLFVCDKNTSSSPFLPYTDELRAEKSLDLSNTFEGLMKNSSLNTGSGDLLYYLPFGGEVRGLFVNKTLLKKENLSVPIKWSEVLSVCQS
jgi:ABC-type glycerol-3-phosphate transport system substrate-binding protein